MQVGTGVVARLVAWLEGFGALLPRKRRRAVLPRARQVLPLHMAPESSEISALRMENERLRLELARLAAAQGGATRVSGS